MAAIRLRLDHHDRVHHNHDPPPLRGPRYSNHRIPVDRGGIPQIPGPRYTPRPGGSIPSIDSGKWGDEMVQAGEGGLGRILQVTDILQ
jgi:hypothetical protein